MGLKVVMISQHSCIRMMKMSRCLVNRGHDVHLLAKQRREGAKMYSSFGHYQSLEQLRDLIRLHAPTTDIFHCHNEPSWFAMLCKEVAPDVPVVMDVHDSHAGRVSQEEYVSAREQGRSLRRYTTEERTSFNLADGLIFPCEPFEKEIRAAYDLTQRGAICPSAVPRMHYAYKLFGPWFPGVVYEGGCVRPETAASDGQWGYRYQDYTQTAQQLTEAGLMFHLYPGNGKDQAFLDHYQKAGAIVQPCYEFIDLIHEIGTHDWGLVGNSIPTREWEIADPNKLYEYMAAGLPVIAWNAAHCAEFVKEHGIGIVVESAKEIVERQGEINACRKNVILKRHRFAMEEYIGRVEGLYREVLNDRECRRIGDSYGAGERSRSMSEQLLGRGVVEACFPVPGEAALDRPEACVLPLVAGQGEQGGDRMRNGVHPGSDGVGGPSEVPGG